MTRPDLGAIGEEEARRHFSKMGWPLLARNWRCPEGELDLVFKEGETIVFVEVRTRSGQDFGYPEETITAAKRRRLLRAGKAYLDSLDLFETNCRFDLVAIECTPAGLIRRFEHIEDVLDDEAQSHRPA